MILKVQLRKVLGLLFFITVTFTGYSEENTEESKTKLEQFSTKTGVVLV